MHIFGYCVFRNRKIKSVLTLELRIEAMEKCKQSHLYLSRGCRLLA